MAGKRNFLLKGQLGEEVVQSPERVEPAVVDDADARAQARGFLHVMRGVDDGEPAAVEGLEVFEDGVARLGVDTDGGLVAEQEFRPVEEGGDEVEPALHAAGERLHWVLASVGELHGGEGLVDAGAEVRAAQAVEFAEDPQVLLGIEFLVEREVLGHEAEIEPGRAVAGSERLAVEGERAAVGPAQAGDEGHQRGLAGPVGSEQAEELAGRNGQRDGIQGGEGTVALGDVVEGEHGGNGQDEESPRMAWSAATCAVNAARPRGETAT